MEEPYELDARVRICAGGGWQQPSLPRSLKTSGARCRRMNRKTYSMRGRPSSRRPSSRYWPLIKSRDLKDLITFDTRANRAVDVHDVNRGGIGFAVKLLDTAIGTKQTINRVTHFAHPVDGFGDRECIVETLSFGVQSNVSRRFDERSGVDRDGVLLPQEGFRINVVNRDRVSR